MKIIFQQKGRDPLYKIWHRVGEDGHMLIYMCSNGGNIVFHDKLLPIQKGVLCYISPNIFHYTLPDIPQNYVRNKIFLSDELFRKILDIVPNNSSFYKSFSEKSVIYALLPDEKTTEAIQAFVAANNAYKESSVPEFIIAYVKLMTLVEKYATDNISVLLDCVAKAIEYINFNYANKLSLDDICRITYVSKHHLCRKFKQTTGITVMDYILSTRITIAKELLLSSNYAISEVADRCGFSSLAYFCQAFKEATGVSAKAYRKTQTDPSWQNKLS